MDKIKLVFSDKSIEEKEVIMCDSVLKRTVGMLFKRHSQDNLAYFIKPCNSIHTFFMAYAIDVLFVDINGCVLKQETVKPYRISVCKKAYGVIEGSSLIKNNFSIEKILFY